MASAYLKPGKKTYLMEFMDQQGKTQTMSSHCKDYGVALSLAKAIERDAERIQEGREPLEPACTGGFLGLKPRQVWKLNEAITAYLDDLERHGSRKEETHYKEVKRKLGTLARECRWATLPDIKADAFTSFLARLAKQGRSPRTQNSYHETLRAFLNWCVSPNKWLKESPLAGLRWPRSAGLGAAASAGPTPATSGSASWPRCPLPAGSSTRSPPSPACAARS